MAALTEKLKFVPDWYEQLIENGNEKIKLAHFMKEHWVKNGVKTLLEIGMGTQPIFSKILAEHVDKYMIIEKEPSPNIRLPSNVTMIQKDFEEVIVGATFDLIILSHVIYYFSDLGDMIRSLAGSIDENDTEFSTMHIREDLYDALADGYASVMGKEWTAKEKENRHLAGPLLVYMQALRFITDHLNGDTYYKISYVGQNFDRAMNQLVLLERLEEFLSAKYGFST